MSNGGGSGGNQRQKPTAEETGGRAPTFSELCAPHFKHQRDPIEGDPTGVANVIFTPVVSPLTTWGAVVYHLNDKFGATEPAATDAAVQHLGLDAAQRVDYEALIAEFRAIPVGPGRTTALVDYLGDLLTANQPDRTAAGQQVKQAHVRTIAKFESDVAATIAKGKSG